MSDAISDARSDEMTSEPKSSRLPALVKRAARLGALVVPALLTAAGPVQAQQAGYGQTLGSSPLERQVYDGTANPAGGSIFDSKNPIDLMNKMRRGTALDDATPPSSAIDEALKQLDAQTSPAANRSTPAAAAPASGQALPAGAPTARPLAATTVPAPQAGATATPATTPGASGLRPSL